MPNDAEQLSRVTKFSICTEQPLWIFFLHTGTVPLTIAFKLQYALFYQYNAETFAVFGQEQFCLAPTYDLDF